MNATPPPAMLYTPPQQRKPLWFVPHLLWNFIGTVALVGCMAVSVAIAGPPAAVSSGGAGMRLAHRFFKWWARSTARFYGLRVWVRGEENVGANKTYIVVPNHRSHMDIPTIGIAVPLRLVAVHKRSLEWIPLLNFVLWLSGSVGLDRTDRAASHRRLKLVGNRLGTGRSVTMFAEGHRSTGPTLERFKKGAAVVALEQQCELLPVTVLGTDVVYPPGQLMVNRGDVLVVIHPPVNANGMPPSAKDALTAQLEQTVASAFVAGPVTPQMLEGARRVV